MDSNEKAILIVSAIKNELKMGTKHYLVDTNELIIDPLLILKAMLTNNLLVQPIEERLYIFDSFCK